MSTIDLGETKSGPAIAVFGEYCDALLYLIESFLSKFCTVRIYSSSQQKWIEKTGHINKGSSLSFHPVSPKESFENPDYIVCSIMDQASYGVKGQVIEVAIELSKISSSKTFFLAPIVYFDKETSALVEYIRKRNKTENLYALLIFVGETYGPRMDANPSGFSQVLLDIATLNAVRLPGRVFYPVFLPDLTRTLIEILFSFGPPAREISIYSDKLSEKEVSRIILETFGQGVISRKKSSPQEWGVKKALKTRTDLQVSLAETVGWLRGNKAPLQKVFEPPAKKIKKLPPEKAKKKNRTFVVVALSIIFFLFIMPFVFLGVSAGSLALAASSINNSRIQRFEFLMKTSSHAGTWAEGVFSYFFSIPLAGRAFEPFYQASGLVKDASTIGLEAVDTIRVAQVLGNKVLGSEVYDPATYAQEISIELERIYQDTGFLLGELNSQKGIAARLFRTALKDVDIEGLRAQTLLLRDISLEIPDILGRDEKRSYLILFQNNMELRPTGGFIGSFAIATFSGGRLSDINIQDVYSADGQLKGHVEPPEPIKEHLGEANWFLRDSNWDPDFPTSASRAEWFLGKEMGVSVDGVLGVDLEVAKSILKITGPIFLSDFNQKVDSENLYEITQKEVEEEFFPGSTKKASFLTALARQLINELTTQGSEGARLTTGVFLQNLQEKHIQLFLHQRVAQRAISSLGFDGSVMVPSCTGNCHADWLGVVEANLGVNKANYFVKREMLLKVGLDKEAVKNQLFINYKNNANAALGVSGGYKAYIRLMLPIEAAIDDLQLLTGQETTTLTADIDQVGGRKEVGFLVEILPGQGKSLSITWSEQSKLDYSQVGEYRLYWRKQAGTGQDLISVQVETAGNSGFTFSPAFSLTGQGNFIYNTNLARDLFSRISW